MNNVDILRAAIKKADERGFDLTIRLQNLCKQVINQEFCVFERSYYEAIEKEPHPLIFAHDFAKAFWGEYNDENDTEEEPEGISSGYEKWEYHLQMMVIEEDPIKYLEQFLNE